MGGDVDRLWNEENHPLVGPTPLIVQSTVVPEGHECPEEVNGEECHSEGNQSNGLQPATKVQVVHGAPQAQPA